MPEVLAVEADCLILGWVEPGKLTTEAAGEFGRALARTHQAGAPAYGLERDGFIGRLPLPNKTAPTWAEFYATKRVLPYLKLARDRDAITPEQAAEVDGVVRTVRRPGARGGASTGCTATCGPATWSGHTTAAAA